MLLIQRNLTSRTFLLQFNEITTEFGSVIPWLHPLKDVAFSTNSSYFRDRILLGLKCKEENDFTAMQFVSSDTSREYIGGIIRLINSPEKFKDFKNIEVQEKLKHENYNYISCLQIRKVHRNVGKGNALMTKALQVLLLEYKKVWGVVSNENLIPWYISLGATLKSPISNKDKLWIISWE